MTHSIKTKEVPIMMVIVLKDLVSDKYAYAYKEVELSGWSAVNTNASSPEEAQAYAIKAIKNKYGDEAIDIIVGKPL